MNKSMTVEKPIFRKMFIKRLLIFALAAFILGAAGTKVAGLYYGMKMANEIENAGEAFLYEMYDAVGEHGDNESQEQFLKAASYTSNFHSNKNTIFVLVNNETGELAAKPLENTLYMTAFYYAGDESLELRREIYICKNEEIANAIRENEAEIGDDKGTLYIDIEDFYLNGYDFIPGKMAIKSYSDEEGNALAEMDFTPTDAAEYTHITVENKEDFHVAKPFFLDAALPPRLIQCMEKTVANLNEWDLFMNSSSVYNDVGSVGYNTCYFDTTYWDGTGPDQGYTVLGICHYNFFHDWLWECLLSYSALLAAVLALAFVTTNVSYMNQKNFYEMNEYRKTITNTMAHDLKSPLMVISGYAENLMEQDLSEKAKRFTKSIMENTEYMNRLIEKSLELSKVESGNIKLNRENLNLREISQGLVSNYNSQLEERGLKVQINGECAVNADRISMKEVLDNLIGNAVKYATEDSEIEIRMSEKTYEVSNVSAAEFDMDANELMKPFVKGDNSRTGKKGSGIGLTIAKNLCRQHGYKLSLECEDGIFTARIDL